MKTYQTILILVTSIVLMTVSQYVCSEYMPHKLTYDPTGNFVIYKLCMYVFIPILTVGLGIILTLILYLLERYCCNEQEERIRLLRHF